MLAILSPRMVTREAHLNFFKATSSIIRARTTVNTPLARCLATTALEEDTEEDDDSLLQDSYASADAQSEHLAWLAGEGAKYRRPSIDGPNWLAKNNPFPLNPTFRPPPPISDRARSYIWDQYRKERKSIAQLGEQFGLSPPRIEAILRLKKLESLWKKEERAIQSRFQHGMELYLGIQREEAQRSATRKLSDQVDKDTVVFNFSRGNRLQRTYFEMTPENEEPSLADGLEKEHEQMLASKENAKKTPQNKGSDKVLWYQPNRPGRAIHAFVDVGHHFTNPRYGVLNDRKLLEKRTKDKSMEPKPRPTAAQIKEKRKSRVKEELAKARDSQPVIDIQL